MGRGGTPAPGATLTAKTNMHERMRPGVGFILKYSGLCVHACVWGEARYAKRWLVVEAG